MRIMGWAPWILLALPSPAFCDAITAEQALKRYRDQFKPVSLLACPRDSEEIVVCARTGRDPNRSPIPYVPQPGDPVRLLPGEPPSAAAALNAEHICIRECEPAVGSIRNVIKGIGALLGKDD